VNCNAAIFVNSTYTVVVDAHSKPSAAAALIAQIRRDITPKPVRYLIDTHFHWDHSQGNPAYLAGGNKVDIVASTTTARLMRELQMPRLKASFDPNPPGVPGTQWVARRLEGIRDDLGKASTDAQRADLRLQIQRMEAYIEEMRNFTPAYPTVTFDKSYVIRDKEHDLHVEFHGRAHTAGDVMVYCPQKRVVATGDAIIGGFPNFADSYPKDWAKTVASVEKLRIDAVLPGHGALQRGRAAMTGLRNYVDEIVGRVLAAKRAGRSVEQMQQSITVGSLKSLAGGVWAGLVANTPAAMQASINTNIATMVPRLDL
jgi:glyoxylase-like metal-dependent hydrolase (beta-lactamase superfamily II)